MTAGGGPVKIDWASPKQEQAFRWPPTPLVCSGGYGAAKTWALCLKVQWILDTFPGSRVLIARKVWEDLKKTTMSTFFKVCPPSSYDHGQRSDTEKFLRLNNGSEVLWMHMQDEGVETVIQGIEINAFFIDQAEEIDEAIFDKLMTRLARWDRATVPAWIVEQAGGIDAWAWKNRVTSDPLVPPYAMLACNPADYYHWIYRRFHPDSEHHWEKTIPLLDPLTGREQLDEEGNPILRSYHDLGYHMIRMKSYENKFLPLSNLQAMMANDAVFRRRYVEGEWGITEGTIHDVSPLSIIETDPRSQSEIVVDSEYFIAQLTETCVLYRTLDHGSSSPTSCGWFAVDRDDNVFVYREYYQPDKMISEHRKAIHAMSGMEEYRTNWADPSIRGKTMQTRGRQFSVQDEYSDRSYDPETAIGWQPANNDELSTRNRIQEYLRVDPDRIHPITGRRGSPRLFFLRASDHYPWGARNILKETISQRREQIGTEHGRPVFSDDRDEKIPDHGYDCLRYLIGSRPSKPTQRSRGANPNSFQAMVRRSTELRQSPERRRRLGYLQRKMREARVGY